MAKLWYIIHLIFDGKVVHTYYGDADHAEERLRQHTGHLVEWQDNGQAQSFNGQYVGIALPIYPEEEQYEKYPDLGLYWVRPKEATDWYLEEIGLRYGHYTIRPIGNTERFPLPVNAWQEYDMIRIGEVLID